MRYVTGNYRNGKKFDVFSGKVEYINDVEVREDWNELMSAIKVEDDTFDKRLSNIIGLRDGLFGNIHYLSNERDILFSRKPSLRDIESDVENFIINAIDFDQAYLHVLRGFLDSTQDTFHQCNMIIDSKIKSIQTARMVAINLVISFTAIVISIFT